MSVFVLASRALSDIRKSPGGVIPDLLLPAFLLVAVVGMFGRMAELSNFGARDYITFLLPLGIVQGAGLVGSGQAVAVGRDIETRFYDRLAILPISRWSVLMATAIAAAARALLSVLFVVIVGLLLGARMPSVSGMLLALLLTAGFAAAAAGWGLVVALGTRSSTAAPLMQAPILLALILGPAFAPRPLLAEWLQPIAAGNPVARILEAVRAPFVGESTWDTTWPGLLSLVVLLLIVYSLAGVRTQRWSA